MSDFIYESEKCTEVIDVDFPDDLLIKLTLMAHKRDITLNHLINEILYEELKHMEENSEIEENV